MTKFLVGVGESTLADRDFLFVEAKNETQAKEKYLRSSIENDKLLISYIYDKSINMSFAEHFWLQGEDLEKFNQTGTTSIDDKEFIQRVKRFFGSHTDFTQSYIDFYFSDLGKPSEPFSGAMLNYIVEKTKWTEILVIPFDEIDVA